MVDQVLAIGVAFLVGFALGLWAHERISRPVMEDHDRLLRREARAMLRGARE